MRVCARTHACACTHTHKHTEKVRQWQRQTDRQRKTETPRDRRSLSQSDIQTDRQEGKLENDLTKHTGSTQKEWADIALSCHTRDRKNYWELPMQSYCSHCTKTKTNWIKIINSCQCFDQTYLTIPKQVTITLFYPTNTEKLLSTATQRCWSPRETAISCSQRHCWLYAILPKEEIYSKNWSWPWGSCSALVSPKGEDEGRSDD